MTTVTDKLPLRAKLRTLWEEIKLRVRVLIAAGGTLFGGDVTPVGRLYVTKVHRDGRREPLGLVSTKVVTDTGVAYIVDALQNLVEPENLRWHGCGTGTTAEAANQTALVTETGSRVQGSLGEGPSANQFRTIATISFGSNLAITEHGIFSASAAGTMLDRSVFSPVNVISGDSIEFTYTLTLPSGS